MNDSLKELTHKSHCESHRMRTAAHWWNCFMNFSDCRVLIDGSMQMFMTHYIKIISFGWSSLFPLLKNRWLTGVILPDVTYFSWFSDPPTDSRWRHQCTALKYFASSLKNNKNMFLFFLLPETTNKFQLRFSKNNNKWKRNLFCAGISPHLSPDDGQIGRYLIEQLLIYCVCAHENAQHLQLAR